MAAMGAAPAMGIMATEAIHAIGMVMGIAMAMGMLIMGAGITEAATVGNGQRRLTTHGSRDESSGSQLVIAWSSRSVFRRSCPHAASISCPFSRRNVAVTFSLSTALRKAY